LAGADGWLKSINTSRHNPDHGTMIVQELRKIQDQWGYLPHEELVRLSRRSGVPQHRLHEVASFFPHFRMSPPPKLEIAVCRDMACALRGSAGLVDALHKEFAGAKADEVEVKFVSCLGRCDRAPVMRLAQGNHSTHEQGAAKPDHAKHDHDSHGAARHESAHHEQNYCGRSVASLLDVARAARAGKPPAPDTDLAYRPHGFDACPWTINPYPEGKFYGVVERFLKEYRQALSARRQGTSSRGESGPVRTPEEVRADLVKTVLGAMETGGLLGMGGAGARSWLKWSDVQAAPGEVKYVVCNGDESEPGTFKDREILLRTPEVLLEGMILAGLIVGAQRGYVYIRHEYEEQIAAVGKAIERARELGVCGYRLTDTDIQFDLEVYVSPGGYICGEQSALIEAMEDKRAEPRNRPPELQTNGLFDKPTVLNNVETFAWVPAIVTRGAGTWYANQERPGCKGRRIFSLSGDVNKPGVYEVPNGLLLRELIELAGGMREGKPLKAFAPSGPSCGFLPAKLPVSALPKDFVRKKMPEGATHYDLLDLPLDFSLVRGEMKLMLGGGLVVYGEGADIVEQARVCSEFFRNESCGKCVPCRLGSQKIAEYSQEIAAGGPTPAEMAHQLPIIRELSRTMEKTSICGLGQVASNPLSTLLTYFQDELPRGS
jgi:formate dehydrogenase beta subunit